MTLTHAKPFVIATLVIVTAWCATAEGADPKAIKVEDPWARRAPMATQSGHAGTGTMANGAVYATVKNVGTTADALVSATSPVADKVELHEVKHDGGVMAMRPIQRLEVPGGGAVQMKPGGYHIMLLGLKHDLNPGDRVPVTLMFERAGAVTVEAVVR